MNIEYVMGSISMGVKYLGRKRKWSFYISNQRPVGWHEVEMVDRFKTKDLAWKKGRKRQNQLYSWRSI